MEKEQKKGWKGIYTFWIVFGTILFILVSTVANIGSYAIGTYNLMIGEQQNIKNQWSNVKTEYQRRADLIGNMAEVVKSYAKFEQKTLIGIAKGRSGKYGDTKEKEMKTMNDLDSQSVSLMGNFVKLQEMYPELKTNVQYLKLLDELQNTENRINIARTDYNGLVNRFNSLILKFPDSIVANYGRFNEEIYYESEEGVEKAEKLNMDLE